MSHNARYARLAIEYTKLMNLSARSALIEVQPVEVQPGWPPEKYIITYRCRGIASIDKQQLPKVSEFHQVSMYMGSDYPLKEPYLRWLTPIWHPNIDHEEPHHVCTNNVQNWFAAKPLAELVLAMGEMVQYKHYHAKWVSPFPLDRLAAQWVLEVAERNGILGPDKPFDDRPLLQALRMRSHKHAESKAAAKKKILLPRPYSVVSSQPAALVGDTGSPRAEAPPLQALAKAIRFGTRTKANGDTRRLVNPVAQPDSGTPFTYLIEIAKDGQFQRVEEISKSQLSIGRGALGKPVDVALEGDLTMSRLHLILERDDSGAFWVTAKGQNPVFVNGRIIPRERSIGVEACQDIAICSYTITIRQAH